MEQTDSNRVQTFFEEPHKYLHKDFGIKIRREIIEGLVKDLSFVNILDVGCGDGSISLPLLNQTRKLHLVDLSRSMISLAKSKVPPQLKENVILENQSLESLKPNKKYDLILAIGLLAHVPNLDAAITLLREMLSANGYLVLQFSDYSKLVTKLAFLTRGATDHKLNRIYKKHLLCSLETKKFELVAHNSFATALPGMGVLNNNLLYKFCRASINSSFFSLINSENILLLMAR